MKNLCPSCNAVLIALEYRGVELDHCLQCKGTWLDPGELEQILILAGYTEEELQFSKTSSVSKTPERHCPRCTKSLTPLSFLSGGMKITIDECPHGDGLWFDDSELKAYLSSASGGNADKAVKTFMGTLFHHELDAE